MCWLSQVKAMFPMVEEVLKRFKKYINDELKTKNEPFEAREICAKFTTDVVSSCIFAADAQSFTKEKPEIREMGRKIMQFSPLVTFMFILYSIFPFTMKIFKLQMVSQEICDFFSNLMYQAIRYREKNNVQRDDYLAYLISLRNKKQLTELDMAAHGVSFFIGKAFDETFATLTDSNLQMDSRQVHWQ